MTPVKKNKGGRPRRAADAPALVLTSIKLEVAYRDLAQRIGVQAGASAERGAMATGFRVALDYYAKNNL